MSTEETQDRILTTIPHSESDALKAYAEEVFAEWRAMSPAEQGETIRLGNIDFRAYIRDDQGKPIVCVSAFADRPSLAEGGDGSIRVRVYYEDKFPDEDNWWENYRREITGTQFADWVSRAARHEGGCSTLPKSGEKMIDPLGQDMLRAMRQDLEKTGSMEWADDEDVVLVWIRTGKFNIR